MSKPKIQMALILLIAVICTPLFGSSAKAFGPVTVWSSSSAQSASYARALQLQYNGSNNGKMYATFETWTGNVPGPSFPIFESTNGGQSWSQVGTVTDVNAGSGEYLREQGFLYELPQQVGSMPAGTMLLAVNSFPDGEQVHNLQLYKSNDLGRSWTYVSTIASGGAYGGGMNWQSQGIWEPFLLVANNKLICYYADEQSSDHNQMVVHRTSTDGVNWSGTVNDVTLGELRPGMPVVTKMGNGQYMLVYEIVGLPHDQVHFKISSNPENWGSPTDRGTSVNFSKGEVPGSQPYVVWIPAGGPNGTVVLSCGGSDKLFLNYNYGQGVWTTQDAVLPASYSRSLVPVGGATVLAVGTVSNSATGNADVKVGTVDTYPSNNTFNGNMFMLVNRNGKTVDLIGGDPSEGAVVNQWSYDSNSLNQRWSIVPTGDGHFKFASRINGKVATVQNHSMSNGAQIVNASYVEGNKSQQWDFVDVGDGWFKVANVRSGKVLEVSGDSTNDNAKLQQWDWNGINAQKWRLQPVGDYYIQAKHSGKYIDIGGGSVLSGAVIIQWPFETNNWFKWRFESAGEGWYKVSSLHATGKVIDVSGSSTSPGAFTNLWDYVGGSNQQVRLVPQSDGSFKLYFKHDGLLWDMAGESLNNGAQLTQWSDLNLNNQKFYLESL